MRVGHGLKQLMESNGGGLSPRQRVARICEGFQTALDEGKISPRDVQLAEVADAFLGTSRYGYDAAARKLRDHARGPHLLEASEAVDASAFSNITGQLLVTAIKEKYESPEFIARKMMRKFANPGSNLQEHKIPYLSDVLNKPKRLAQLEPYPHTTFAESWVQMPAPAKWGEICAVSMEMLLSDYTGQAQDSAESVGRAAAYQEEEQCAAVILGLARVGSGSEVFTPDQYVWNGHTLNTFVSTAGAGSYVNRLANTTVSNYTNFNTIEALFFAMNDPITGRKINARPTTIYVDYENRYLINRLLNATEVREGDVTSGAGVQTIASNPINQDIKYKVVWSPIWHDLLVNNPLASTNTTLTADQAKNFMLFMDPLKAYGYREVYPFRTEDAPRLNPGQFHQDIELQVKVSRFGVPFVYDPRFAAEVTPEGS